MTGGLGIAGTHALTRPISAKMLATVTVDRLTNARRQR